MRDIALTVVAPDELLIRQTPRELFIEHPSKPGTHPETGTFEYESGGFIGDPPGSLTPLQGRLVIEFGEERAGERPTIATRTYMKVTPQ